MFQLGFPKIELLALIAVLKVAPRDEDALHCKIVGLIKADNLDEALSAIRALEKIPWDQSFTVDFSFDKKYILGRCLRKESSEAMDGNSVPALWISQNGFMACAAFLTSLFSVGKDIDLRCSYASSSSSLTIDPQSALSVALGRKEEFNTSKNTKKLLHHWTPVTNTFCDEVLKDQAVWSKVFGVPLHLWSTKIFKIIGECCGGFLEVGHDTSSHVLSDIKLKVQNIKPIHDKSLIITTIIELEDAYIGGGVCFIPVKVEKMNKDRQ
ncbi:hypothetical protein GIB67_029631 [Kingdonia uniflora]|uniref:DUF4283 domain-containing protein n=1 Tax=Kingdonia uniflora TaxID=39325 RepID=A0A7J7LLN7_9MAGN|nr:hypothetical protein GIB67_029631 [Kingdonia uniflora]